MAKHGASAERILITVPNEMGRLLKLRAEASYRSISQEARMLIDMGLTAEKTAPEHTA